MDVLSILIILLLFNFSTKEIAASKAWSLCVCFLSLTVIVLHLCVVPYLCLLPASIEFVLCGFTFLYSSYGK